MELYLSGRGITQGELYKVEDLSIVFQCIGFVVPWITI